MSLNKLLKYRLKEVDSPSNTWSLKERVEHWIIERWWNFKQHSKIMRLWWKFAHRHVPKHQYHIIRIRDLEPGYHDPDTRIKHAVFQEVCDFVKHSSRTTDWEEARVAPIFADLQSISNYWLVERPKLEEELSRALDAWCKARFGNFANSRWVDKMNKPMTEEQLALHKIHSDLEKHIEEEDKRHLMLAIKHLDALWY